VRLDNRERFRQMVLEAKAEHESGLVPAGHAYVNRRLRAAFNLADYASEQMTGLSTSSSSCAAWPSRWR
jgi:presequence protease